MKKVLSFSIIPLMLLMIWTNFSSAAVTIEGGKRDAFIKIKTDTYEVHWKTGAQMGYMVALVKGKALFDDKIGRRLYHSANYAGWKDWGALTGFKILNQKKTMAKVEFVSDDGASKEYICVATFWDGTPLIKHEITVKAKKAVASFSHGHEPMYEVTPVDDMKKWDSKGDKGPFAHNAFFRDSNFSALYAIYPTAQARLHGTRMDLVQDGQGKQLKKGQTSDPLVYWVAFGVGGEKEAHALAETVAEVKDGDLQPEAVDADEKLSITWGAIKDIR